MKLREVARAPDAYVGTYFISLRNNYTIYIYVLMLRNCYRLFIWLPKFTYLGQQADTEQPTWLFRRKILPPVASDSRCSLYAGRR